MGGLLPTNTAGGAKLPPRGSNRGNVAPGPSSTQRGGGGQSTPPRYNPPRATNPYAPKPSGAGSQFLDDPYSTSRDSASAMRGYYQDVRGYQSNLASAWDGQLAANASQMADFANRRDSLAAQLGFNDQQYGLTLAGQREDFSRQMDGLNGDRAANAIDMAAAGRDPAYYNAMFANQTAQFTNNWQGLDQLGGTTDANHLLAQAYFDAQNKGIGEKYAITEEQLAQQNAFNSLRDRVQMAVGGGGDKTEANFFGTQKTASDLSTGRAANLSDRDLAQAGLTKSRGEEKVAYDQTLAEIKGKRNSLFLDLGAAGISRDRQVAQAQDRQKQLKIQADQFGLTAGHLQRGLELALQQAGLDQQISAGKILENINSNNAAEQQVARSMLVNAQTIAGTMPGGGGSTGASPTRVTPPQNTANRPATSSGGRPSTPAAVNPLAAMQQAAQAAPRAYTLQEQQFIDYVNQQAWIKAIQEKQQRDYLAAVAAQNARNAASARNGRGN